MSMFNEEDLKTVLANRIASRTKDAKQLKIQAWESPSDEAMIQEDFLNKEEHDSWIEWNEMKKGGY